MKYEFNVSLDERGDFQADVDNERGDSVYRITSGEHMAELVDDGFMRHKHDVRGLTEMLQMLGIIEQEDEVELGCI